MSGIGIVGAGISGVHLALRLQQAGLPTTLYAERTVEELASGPPTNLAVRFGNTRARERTLGVAPWDAPEHGMAGVNFSAPGDPSFGFWGRLTRPGSAVDFRVYLPALMADYAERGGTIEVLAPSVESVGSVSGRHDLVVVASGRRSVTELFPRDPARSPYATPQRILTAGFYRGIAPQPGFGLHFQFSPGVGEIFRIDMLTTEGVLTGMNIEAAPGGPLEHLAALSYDEDPAAFDRAVLAALGEHAPGLRELVEAREFGLAGPNHLLQGGITPTVRTGWAALPGGGYAMAVGDAWVVNDPITGQGANLGSASAFRLAEEIVAGPPYDAAFCRRAENRMWEYAGVVTEWTNAFLGPPPPHALELLAAASVDSRIADGYIDLFDHPVSMWNVLGTPEGTAAWLRGFAS